MNQIRVGISCIGSGVGQSVINSCNLSGLNLYTIGFGTNPLAYGLYECDEYAITKSFYDTDYIESIIKKCHEYSIDIFIPGHDDDAHIVSKNIEKFDANGIKVIVAGEQLLDLCRDKEKMSDDLNKIADLFVKSFDKDGFIEAFKNGSVRLPVIAKPRSGFASRGIEIILSENDFSLINDSHIVQELAVPHKEDPQREFFDKQISKRINPQLAEISIQVVADDNGEIIGKMISYNKLNNGVPIEIIPYKNEAIWGEVDKLIPTLISLGHKGPLNLQGRLTDSGLKLFEMNARFTGITGLRAYMGFNEVEACIKSWMGIRNPAENLELNHDRFGIRQTADKSISLDWNKEVKEFSTLINKATLKAKKTILITGATGFVGRNLIFDLISQKPNEYEIWAYTRNKDKGLALFETYANVEVFDYSDFKNGILSMGNVDLLLHLGFARPYRTNLEIAQSLEFTHELFARAVKNQVASIVNISSQSVYGKSEPLWTEDTPVEPYLPYSQAKLSTELLLKSLNTMNPHIHTTSIRLAGVSGALEGAVIQDLPSKLVNKLFNNQDLLISGADQTFEYIDIRDVVKAMIALIQSDSSKWQKCYNLGVNRTYTLGELADECVTKYNAIKGTKLEVKYEDGNRSQKFGMVSTPFYNLTKWSPEYNLSDMIESIIEFYSKES